MKVNKFEVHTIWILLETYMVNMLIAASDIHESKKNHLHQLTIKIHEQFLKMHLLM